LVDGGSYKYNTDQETLNYFMGTASHNTVMLENYDQMKKGSRFIWYNWTQAKDAFVNETEESYNFKGAINAFSYLSKGIVHEREVIKDRNNPKWIVKDRIINKPDELSMRQLWHLPLKHLVVLWKSVDEKNEEISEKKLEGYFSELYGKKEVSQMIVFETHGEEITTEFEIVSANEKKTKER
jgi:hypothetical protein